MTKLLSALLLIATAMGGWLLYGAYERQVGALRATIAVREAAIDSLRVRAARVDTVYRTRVDTLRLVRARTDSVLVLLPGDTVTRIRVDTVRQLVAQERAACDAVVLTCEQRVAARDSVIRLQATQITALRQPDRLFGVLPAPSKEVTFAIGAALGLLLGRK